MAYVYDNKTYRNLQQQVKENMDNIAELQEMKLVGIDVAGIVADYSSLPSSAEQGQVYAVGTSSPYELYVYNDSSWVDFGEFPKAGPQGEQGPQGEPGRQGPRGLTGAQGPRGYTGAPGTPGQAGPQGEKGPKGDKGNTGLVDAFAKDSASITAVGQAYVDANGYLQVCTSLSPLTFEQGGYIKGPIGERGPSGQQGVQGIQGPEGPVGPQGPKGDTGEPSSIKVNGTTYISDASGLITLPDYPDEVAWGNIQGTLSDQTDLKTALDAKQDIASLSKVATSGSYNDLKDRPLFKYPGDVVQYGPDPIRTIYGGSRVIFENGGHPGEIIGDIVNLDIPTLTWGLDYEALNGPISAYGYNDNPDTVEACYKCWKIWIDEHHAKAGDTINLKLKYTDSAGKLHTFSGTGVLHSDSFIDPVLKDHKVILDDVNFRGSEVAQASFSIIPKYGQIDLYMHGLNIGPAGEPVTNITISMDVPKNDIIRTPINSGFIGTDIARTADIPTKTSQLTNDSNFVTSTELSTVATSGSYDDLIDKPTITNVSGVNDGTNWTSLTIGSDTYGLGGGGGSGWDLSDRISGGSNDNPGNVRIGKLDSILNISGGYSLAGGIGAKIYQNAKGALAFGYDKDNRWGVRSMSYGSIGLGYSTATDSISSAGYGSAAIGYGCTADPDGSIALGKGTKVTAGNIQGMTACGSYNVEGSGNNFIFVVGNGTSSSARSNAFTVNTSGNVVAAGTVSPTGADYAEYFEFEDGNPNNEDRIGLLVELINGKIRLANGIDILGAISGSKCIIGDAEEMNWHGKYERDEFGRYIYEDYEFTNNEGSKNEYKVLTKIKKISKDYDPTKTYIPRSDRPEWAPVGLLGKVLVRHDGTLSAGDYVKAVNGIASKSDEKTNVRVLEVISDKVIKVLIK